MGRTPNGLPCSADGCQALGTVGRGMCRKHYVAWYRRRPVAIPCAAEGCNIAPYTNGYCAKHWGRIKRHGDPDVSLRPRRDRYIDRSGYVMVHQPDHAAANAAGKVAEHRIVMESVLGRALLPGENVHHRNGVRHDNRPGNLELWVTTQPAGQRPADLVAWAHEILARYEAPPG